MTWQDEMLKKIKDYYKSKKKEKKNGRKTKNARRKS